MYINCHIDLCYASVARRLVRGIHQDFVNDLQKSRHMGHGSERHATAVEVPHRPVRRVDRADIKVGAQQNMLYCRFLLVQVLKCLPTYFLAGPRRRRPVEEAPERAGEVEPEAQSPLPTVLRQHRPGEDDPHQYDTPQLGGLTSPRTDPSCPPLPPLETKACLLRTKGKRLEFALQKWPK